MINTILDTKIKVETKKESELVYDATNLATCNANLAVAISALKTITHDTTLSSFLTEDQFNSIQNFIKSFK